MSTREHVIDIEKLALSLTTERKNGHLTGESGKHETGRPQIHRIKVHIRERYKNAYALLMLSIGPYNHKLPAVQAMQQSKYEFLDYILNLNREKELADYLDAMKDIENTLRSCYADEFNMERIDFLKMLLLDGCFMLVALRGIESFVPGQLQGSEESNRASDATKNTINSEIVIDEEVTLEETNPETSQHYLKNEDYQETLSPTDEQYTQDLWHDLLLLENQIPLFVMTKIHDVMVQGSNSRNTTSELAVNISQLVEIALSCYPKAISTSNRPTEFYHLLHLCHMYFQPCGAEIKQCNETNIL